MKDWILKHKKLYFFIVGVIAFIAFMAITLHGVKRASAATETVTANIGGTMKEFTVPDIREVDWSYWLTLDGAKRYNNPQDLPAKIISDCSYLIVRGVDPGYITYFFYKEPFYYDGPLSIQANISLNFDSGYAVTVAWRDGVPRVEDVAGLFDNSSNADNFWLVMYNGGSCMVGSTYDYLVNCTDYRKDEITRNNLTYPQLVSFSSDAPYFSYKDVIGCFPSDLNLAHGGVLTTFYNALSSAEWIYTGKLNNMNSDATSYRTELEFVVELPTFECLDNLIGLKEGVAYYEYGAEKVADRFEDAILKWGEHFGTLDKQVYRFKYPLIIEPSSDGSFHVKLTYADILNYIRYFNEDARTLFNQYSKGHQGLMSMFARIHSVSGHVVTSYPSGQVTGRTTYNEWGSLLYDSCLEVFVDYDKDDENFDSAFDDAYDKGYDSYVGGLKDEILNLQTQLDNYHKVHDAFGNLGSSDIWSGFTGIISGLASFGSSIRGLSVLAGSVFAFFPLAVTGIMSATLLAICVIAIIKAIRG